MRMKFKKHWHDGDITSTIHRSNRNADSHMPCREMITLCTAYTLTDATCELTPGAADAVSIPTSQADVMIREVKELVYEYKASDWQIIDSGTDAPNSKVSQLLRDA